MKLLHFRTGTLLLSLVCFCLPFVRVSCNKQPFMEAAGIEMAVGQEFQFLDFTKTISMDSVAAVTHAFNSESKKKKEDTHIDIRWEALTALVLLIAAILAGFIFRRRVGVLVGSISAFLGTVALVLLYVNLWKEQGGSFGIEVEYKMLAGYWLSLGLMVLGAILGIVEYY